MRSRLICVILFCLCAASVSSAATIREAYSRHMEMGQFQLLREFFTGKEATGNRAIFRSDPEERTGQYFVLSLDTPLRDLKAGTSLVLEVISTDDLDPVRYTFDLDASKQPSTRRIYIGLTGEAWPSPQRKALAWRLQLMNGSTVEDEWKSFLWEMP